MSNIGSIVNIQKNESYFNEIDKSVNGFINNKKFIVPKEEIHYRAINWDKNSCPNEVNRMVSEGFTAEVIDETLEGTLILSRKKCQLEEYEKLEIGSIVTAQIIGITKLSVFVEICNGLVAVIHPEEYSRTKLLALNAMPDYLKLNDKIKIKILKKSENKISASRKRAYPHLTEVADFYKTGDIILVTPTKRMNFDGMWAEVTPNIIGILNAGEQELNRLQIGKTVLARVQRVKEKGLKVHLINK